MVQRDGGMCEAMYFINCRQRPSPGAGKNLDSRIESGYAAGGRYVAGGGAASFSLLQRVGVNTARCGALGVATVGY